jgi:hypothetical protein
MQYDEGRIIMGRIGTARVTVRNICVDMEESKGCNQRLANARALGLLEYVQSDHKSRWARFSFIAHT